MTEGFWKWLANQANKELARRELKQRTAGIYNRLDALAGQFATAIDAQALGLRTQVAEEISDQFASAGPLIVQRVNETMNPKLNDVAVVLKDIFEERTQKGFTLNAQLLGRILGNLAVASSKAEKRQNYIMQGFDELSRQNSLHDQGNSDRYLSLHKEIRQLNDKIDYHAGLMQSMQVKFFESLSLQIQMASSKGKERYSPAPKVEWLFDHVDDMIELCDALKAARSNDAPRSTMKMRALAAIRRMGDFTGVSKIRGELDRLFNSWDNDTQAVAAYYQQHREVNYHNG